MIKVSLPGPDKTTIVRVEADDDGERVLDRVEDALRGILGGETGHSPQPDPDPASIYSPTREITPKNGEDLYELSVDIAGAVSGLKDLTRLTGQPRKGVTVTLRFEGVQEEGQDTQIVAYDSESWVVVTGLDIIPPGESSDIQGLRSLFDKCKLEGQQFCCVNGIFCFCFPAALSACLVGLSSVWRRQKHKMTLLQ